MARKDRGWQRQMTRACKREGLIMIAEYQKRERLAARPNYTGYRQSPSLGRGLLGR